MVKIDYGSFFMKKILYAMGIIGLLVGCSSHQTQNNSVFSYYSEVNAYFDKRVDMNGKYKLLLSKEIPLPSEYIARKMVSLNMLKRLNQETPTAVFSEELRKSKEILTSGKIKVESYIHVIEFGDNPIVEIYNVSAIKTNGITVEELPTKFLLKVKFDCKKANNDLLVEEWGKDRVAVGKEDSTDTISELLNPVNTSGGQKITIRVYFPNDKYTEASEYYSKEKAKSLEEMFDKAKQMACGF